MNLRKKGINGLTVLVPFYRGAVVFHNRQKIEYWSKRFSSPFIEERLYFIGFYACGYNGKAFSSPFIEERLYLVGKLGNLIYLGGVLVPFYRGAVVF